jgi:hypothetical protein
MCQTSELDSQLVKDALSSLDLPNEASVWVGPYEQLHGAGFALLAARQYGVYERDLQNYHTRVRTKIVSLILEHADTGRVSDKSAFNNAIAGFYFNAAIQRIVWASERLVKTFVTLECTCDRPPEKNAKSRKFNELVCSAFVRMHHLLTEDGRDHTTLKDMSGMLKQLKSNYGDSSKYNPAEALSMLRYDVNKRKHAVFGPQARDRKSARLLCDDVPRTWSDAPQNCQMHLACAAFEVVCRAYRELVRWQPTSK